MEDILNALGVEKIEIYFQPIVSLQKLKVVGLEALSRGINQGKIVPPAYLFSLAKELDFNLELDRICRKLALCEFKKIRQQYNDLLLFLNHDPSLLDKNGVMHGFTYQLVKEIGLPPRSIVIEICESKVTNMDSLSRFVSDYKKYGFLLALDDVGNSHSNLNRIPELKPDILKIDRGLIKDVDKSWHKNKILKSISYLAREIRTLIIAEGVETKEEIMEILEIGVEFFQGFYFEKPKSPDKITFNIIENKAKEIVIICIM
jgi:EAL domain-containing protein (putative c-di-GMP-specific phosphodiesterase class I)